MIGIIVYASFSVLINSSFKSVNVEIYTVAQTLAEDKLEEMLARDFAGLSAEAESAFSGDLNAYTYQVVTNYVTAETLDAPTTEATDYRRIQVMIRHPKMVNPVTLEAIKADYDS